MFTIIGAMAELKWSLISERVTPGMKAAQTVVGTEQQIAITTPSRATADERAFPHNCNAKESDNATAVLMLHTYTIVRPCVFTGTSPSEPVTLPDFVMPPIAVGKPDAVARGVYRIQNRS